MKGLFINVLLISALTACGSADESNRVVGELASDRIELSAEFNEPIVEIVVAEGDKVSVGQLLLRQNDARARARLDEAQAIYLQSKARMDELLRGPRGEQISAARATVEGATQDLDFRQNELIRVQEIHRRGLASADALDKANAALDAAQATLKLRLAQLEELLAGTTVEELAQAEQSVKQAMARREGAEIDVARLSLVAPVSGVVDSRLFEIGERPGVGQPLLVMLGGVQPYARVYVPENLRVQIGSGTKARVFVDGLDRAIAGQVRWVSSEPAFTPYFALTERDRGRLSYVAKIDILNEATRLPDGVPVEVEFELD
ncbi:MAG: HlyD family efflux transporter periplasmic adaptor subunit [Chromatiales bacterium]|nr:MAG: HlyD family efflux transporter periplasmic adaptor subunit [Chromatiales bacterium]